MKPSGLFRLAVRPRKSLFQNERTWQNVPVGMPGNHAQNLSHTVQSEQLWFGVFVPQIIVIAYSFCVFLKDVIYSNCYAQDFSLKEIAIIA